MKTRILILGAGFGGLELSTLLSQALPDQLDITLLDQNDSFFFGFSKLEVMFGRATPGSIRLPYSKILKPAVTFRQETIRAIDPVARRVTTNRATHDADILVVALGADYDFAATPGLRDAGHEFYSLDGAEKIRHALPAFTSGHAIVGVCHNVFKCPPAPSEAALLLHDYLTDHGLRQTCHISLVMPFGTPIPPSPDTSKALLQAFADRGITFVPGRTIASLDPAHRIARLDDNSELPFDLFLGIPKHRTPDVVANSPLATDGWIRANPKTLETQFPNVYAIGDVIAIGIPKAGLFAEGAARIVAARILASLNHGPPAPAFDGKGACYIEFGQGQVGRVDVDFFSGPKPAGTHHTPTAQLTREKHLFAASRRTRWFNL